VEITFAATASAIVELSSGKPPQTRSGQTIQGANILTLEECKRPATKARADGVAIICT